MPSPLLGPLPSSAASFRRPVPWPGPHLRPHPPRPLWCFLPDARIVSMDHVFRIDPSKVEDGKGKSPYDPRHNAASVLVGDELYAGVATDLMGRDFTIFRSLGKRPSIRTEQHDSRWLNEPKFVGSFWVPESENPDDDKVFFFFRETAVEAQGLGKSTYSRIGQLCRNDMGGQRSLVNKWTTFLKTRLICSVPGADGSDTYFDELRDVFLLQTRDRKNPLVYTVFSTSSSVFKGSAVCVYSMNDIRRAFLGPFAHKEGPNYQWVPFQGKVPYPRPGMVCPKLQKAVGSNGVRVSPSKTTVKSHKGTSDLETGRKLRAPFIKRQTRGCWPAVLPSKPTWQQ
ncbi:semaphorin-3B-like [Notothenia coriiceps]|uniref:Semaphorin-3B-like n=1 Tax=Notothenia coriiceps TaxID=8208 RepID=A0A6I9PH01_9TELE|nr:PREDICTED: semaphorin-3B-like [Notothenia coriiceps]